MSRVVIAATLMFALSIGASAQSETPGPGSDRDVALDDFSDLEAQAPAPVAGPVETDAPLDRIAAVVAVLDGNAERTGDNWQLMVGDTVLLVITDRAAERMRIMTPIADAAELDQPAMRRLLQANFDTALDARYAIAQGQVWGTFIHPLPSLTERDFASGLLQTVTLADTYGTLYSSGAPSYGDGDSGLLIEERLEQLLRDLDPGV